MLQLTLKKGEQGFRLLIFILQAKQRCVMGVGMCLYAQLVQTKNKQCKSAIIIQCYHPHLSDFCSRPRLTQPYNHIGLIYPGVAKIYLVVCCIC